MVRADLRYQVVKNKEFLIARAILKDAPIIIFDEATANVDPENEDKLQRAMEELMKDKTVIMIAHRLKTVKHASKIIVINNGQIVQQGTHQQLIKEDGLYKKFVEQKNETGSWKLYHIYKVTCLSKRVM